MKCYILPYNLIPYLFTYTISVMGITTLFVDHNPLFIDFRFHCLL